MSNFFTYAERISLQKFLGEGLTFKEIARTLGKDPSTISREVRKHMSKVATGRPGYPYNPCKHRTTCRAKKLCSRGECHRSSIQYCKLCTDCSKHCPDFLEEICTSRFKVPYVCNGCSQIDKCTLMKNIYDVEHVQYKVHDVISQSRSGRFTYLKRYHPTHAYRIHGFRQYALERTNKYYKLEKRTSKQRNGFSLQYCCNMLI